MTRLEHPASWLPQVSRLAIYFCALIAAVGACPAAAQPAEDVESEETDELLEEDESPEPTEGASDEASERSDASRSEPSHRSAGTEAEDPETTEEEAEPGEYPIPHIARPLNLPQGYIRAGGTLGAYHYDEATSLALGADVAISLSVGASVGVTDWLELGIAGERLGTRHFVVRGAPVPIGAVPIALTPDLEFGDIPVWARFGVIRDPSFDVSVDVGAIIPTESGRAEAFVAAAVRARASELFTVDTGMELGIRFPPPDNRAELDLWIPFSFLVQPIDAVFFAARSGVAWRDFDDLVFPLAFEFGYTVATETRPLMDVILGFGFPALLVPNADGDKAYPDVWQVTISGQAYFSL